MIIFISLKNYLLFLSLIVDLLILLMNCVFPVEYCLIDITDEFSWDFLVEHCFIANLLINSLVFFQWSIVFLLIYL